jgi:hypothetical protein
MLVSVAEVAARLPENFRAALFEEPLPPYELDPTVNDHDTRARVGDLIAQAVIGELFKPK